MPDTVIRITTDSQGAVQGIQAVGNELNTLNQTASKGTGGVAGFGQQFVAFERELGAASLAVAPFVAGIGAALKIGSDWQTQTAQLNAVLKSTGGVAGVTADQAINLAHSYSEVSRYSDDAILSAENLLLTFTNISSSAFPDATKVVLDMSTALGQDLKQSAIQVGKALQDPEHNITNLRRVGVNFNDTMTDMIKNMARTGDIAGADALIMKELSTEFGGSAAAAADTFAGKVDKATNALKRFLEVPMGNALTGMTAIFQGGYDIINHASGADNPKQAAIRQAQLAQQTTIVGYDAMGMPMYGPSETPSAPFGGPAMNVSVGQRAGTPTSFGAITEGATGGTISQGAYDQGNAAMSAMLQNARYGLHEALGDVSLDTLKQTVQTRATLQTLIEKASPFLNEQKAILEGTVGTMQEQLAIATKRAQIESVSQAFNEKYGTSQGGVYGELGQGMDSDFQARRQLEQQRLQGSGKSKKQVDAGLAAFDTEQKRNMDNYMIATGQATMESIKFADMQSEVSKSFRDGKISASEYTKELKQLADQAKSGAISMDDLNQQSAKFAVQRGMSQLGGMAQSLGGMALGSLEKNKQFGGLVQMGVGLAGATGLTGALGGLLGGGPATGAASDPFADLKKQAGDAQAKVAGISTAAGAIPGNLQAAAVAAHEAGQKIASGMAPGNASISAGQQSAARLQGILKSMEAHTFQIRVNVSGMQAN